MTTRRLRDDANERDEATGSADQRNKMWGHGACCGPGKNGAADRIRTGDVQLGKPTAS
jgi:hypothetical protein